MNTNFKNQLHDELPHLMKTARWLASDEQSAEDLLQDTAVLALRFKESFEGGTNMRAWLTRVMKNRHISNIRRRSLETRIMETEGSYSVSFWSVGHMGLRTTAETGDVHMDTEFCDTVKLAVEGLRPEFKQVVLLCDVDGMSYAEAAKKISCPVGTIMSRLHRGRKALRKRLGSRIQVEQAA